MKLIIDYKVKKNLESIGIECEIGQSFEIYDDKKLQQLKLIWKSVNHIVSNCDIKIPSWMLLNSIMIEGEMLSENSLVRYRGQWLNPSETEVRASLELKDNTRKSYNKIIELIKEYHKEKNIDDFLEFWKDQKTEGDDEWHKR